MHRNERDKEPVKNEMKSRNPEAIMEADDLSKNASRESKEDSIFAKIKRQIEDIKIQHPWNRYMSNADRMEREQDIPEMNHKTFLILQKIHQTPLTWRKFEPKQAPSPPLKTTRLRSSKNYRTPSLRRIRKLWVIHSVRRCREFGTSVFDLPSACLC